MMLLTRAIRACSDGSTRDVRAFIILLLETRMNVRKYARKRDSYTRGGTFFFGSGTKLLDYNNCSQ